MIKMNVDSQWIAEGIEAIVMGKRGDERKSDKEPEFDEGVGFSEMNEDKDLNIGDNQRHILQTNKTGNHNR